MRVRFSVIVKENCQESLKGCIMLPHIHTYNNTTYLHNTPYMKNELGKFEGGQGCVIVSSLVRKVKQSLPLKTLCPFNGQFQTLY